MSDHSKRKLLLVTVFLTMLLISSAYTALIPNVNAAETTIQEKGLSILGDVVGLDLAKYTVTTKEYQLDSSASYLGVVPQENVAYDLTSDDSKLKVLYTFANGNLQMIHVLEREGPLSLVKPTPFANALGMAKDFLSNYQMYTANPLFGELRSTLDTVDVNKNLTKTIGTKHLEVTINNGYTSFKWYYTSNGVIAPFSKFVSLVFKDGFLAGFVDNWQLYNVGTASVNFNEKEAIAIALDAAKAHSWSLKLEANTLDAKNFNESNVRWTSLIFDDSLNTNKARSEDVLALYPVWRVGIALDKWYGYMYGIEVDVWADTGEVRSVQEAWSTMPPPEGVPSVDMNKVDNLSSQVSDEKPANMLSSQAPAVSEVELNPVMWVALSTLASAFTGTALIFLHKKKKSSSIHLLKPRYFKIGGMLLCGLILSMTALASVATVTATTKTAVIWGSESTGAAAYQEPWINWRKSKAEVDQQRATAITLGSYFQDGGYAAYNHQGIRNPGSSKAQIIDDTQTYTDTSSRVAFVDFDHGIGSYINGEFHFMFEDNEGTMGSGNPLENGVFDRDVYWRTWYGKTLFAFISTCMSANLTHPDTGEPWQGYGTQGAKGLPYAFTHGLTVVDREQASDFNIEYHMSDDAYFYPDDGVQVYIGFPWGSPSLSQPIPYDTGPHNYAEWVDSFFDYALHYDDMSVNHALDHASFELWGMYFANPYVPLRGFTAHWDYFTDFPDCTMAIYGNGRLRLKSFGDDFNDGNYNGWTVTQGSWSASTGTLRSQQQYSLIRTNQQFTTDRHVRVQAKTLTSGPDNWDVAWVMAKYVDTNNMVYGLLHKNGLVELSIVKNGQKLMWSGSSPFNPLNTNTIEVNIVGTKAWVWVNGNLKLTATHDWLDDFGGYAALYSHTGSTAEFDDITVLEQTYQTTNHKLIISSTAGGSTNPSPDTYRYTEGTPVTITANPQSGCVLDHWQLDGQPAGSNPTIIATMNQFHTLQANFRPALYYDLTISAGSGGSTTPPPGTYEDIQEGTPVTVTANPNSGYVFDHWELDYQPAGSNPTIIVTMNSNHNLQAYFAVAPSYSWVSSIDSYDGAVYDPENLVGSQPDGQFATIEGYGPYQYFGWIIGAMNEQAAGHIYVYGAGDGPLYVYASGDGYNFDLVSVPYVSSGSPYWIDCGSYLNPFNYIAVTAEDPNYFYSIALDSVRVDPPVYHTLTVSSGSGGSTMPSPDAYQYAEGTPVAVTANPDSGYVLDYWLLDGQNAGSQNPITVTMDSDHTLQANFVEGTPPRELTVLAYNQYSEPGYVPLYIDEQYVGTTGYAYTVTSGNHQIYVESPLYDGYGYHEFQYYYYDGIYNYDNPMTLSVTSDKTVTAYYYSYY